MKVTTTILSTLAAATLVSAGTFHIMPDTVNVVPRGYIIQYQDGFVHTQAHNNLNSHNVDYKVRNEFSIFNGAAIQVQSGHHKGEDIASIPGIKNVWPITLHSMPKVKTDSKHKPTDPEVVSDHHMTGVDIVHKKLKLTGKGIKVGVIDTGVDYNHPAFASKGADKGCFGRHGKNCRVQYGWDFVGDDYTGENTPKPDADPMDCFGHGSHVAGIIGANALNIKTTPKPPQPFVGVAPEVTLGAYRIFGCKGNAGDDVIMAAMEMAFNDGMDIINMSLGGGSSYKYNPQAVLGDKLVAKGMVLAAAAGNDGSEGVWMVSDTGLGDLSSSVASFDNIYGFYNSFTYDKVAHPYAPSEAWAKTLNVLEKDTLLPIFEKDGSLSDGCDAALYKGLDLKNKVVLVVGDIARCRSKGRGDIGLAAGAAGMLVQTTPLGMAGLAGNDKLPMGSIEFKAGEALLAAYKKNPKNTLSFSKAESNFLVEGGGAPSDFSSFGLDGELRSKPDLAAPGGNILSTYPLAKGGYTLMSGTSMATPYIAGAHAIYMQAKHAKPHGDEIRKVFKNTATISKNAGSKTFASAAKQGAGLINLFNAVTVTSSISPDHIDLLDTNHLKKTVKITLKNNGKKTETYKLSHVPADALNSYKNGNSWPAAVPVIEADSASVVFSQDTVKIPAGKSAQITLHFSEPKAGKASQFPIYSGFAIATPSSKGGVAVHVPYTGLKGDVSKVPIMDVDLKFPKFEAVNLASGNLTALPKDLTFDFKSTLPVFTTRFGSHTPSAEIRIFDAKKNSFVGFLAMKKNTAVGWSGRQKNVDDDGDLIVNHWIWSGEVITSANSTLPVALPSGTYNVVIASQRKLTKGEYPKDYETFEFKGIKF
ncbi:hypothetical protein BGZ83_004866 [Gryganskiella cystojenkinii]|nr:hypothetical protein BGZ83_004866 [Gryganskiella cystojenkinii]